MPSLFAYGTLCNQNVQKILFGRTLPGRDYVLHGYTVCPCNDGFFTIKALSGSCVTGKILELTDDDLAIADEWELVPLYERIRLRSDSGETWTYIRSDMADVTGENADGFSAYPEDELLNIVREFMMQRQQP